MRIDAMVVAVVSVAAVAGYGFNPFRKVENDGIRSDVVDLPGQCLFEVDQSGRDVESGVGEGFDLLYGRFVTLGRSGLGNQHFDTGPGAGDLLNDVSQRGDRYVYYFIFRFG